MKIIKFWFFTSLILTLTILNSCGKTEDLGYEHWDLKITGIQFNSERRAELPQKGGSFTVEPYSTKGHSGVGHVCLETYMVNGVEYNHRESQDFTPPYYGSTDWLKGEWGEVTYLTDTAPYQCKITILPNEESTTRTFRFRFGCCNQIVKLYVTQKGTAE